MPRAFPFIGYFMFPCAAQRLRRIYDNKDSLTCEAAAPPPPALYRIKNNFIMPPAPRGTKTKKLLFVIICENKRKT
jgi:hypothetical protein